MWVLLAAGILVILNSCAGQSCDFQCYDGACAPAEYLCDGKPDCSDGLDEAVDMCKSMSCPTESTFDCYVSRAKGDVSKKLCIFIAYTCDGAPDCANGEDEFCVDGCHNTSMIRCNDGTCKLQSARCNGKPDCPDGEDEKDCKCDVRTQFQCVNGSCIQSVRRCDKHRDCPHGEDEATCPKRCDNYFDIYCSDGACIPSYWKCDIKEDCTDGGDEDGCPCDATEFQCADLSCIPHAAKCNVKNDCPGGDDELNCPVTVQIKTEKSVEGSSVTLSCFVQGFSQEGFASFQWSFRKSDTDAWKTIDSRHEITIEDVTYQTAGIYQCTALIPTSNSSGSSVISVPDGIPAPTCEFACADGRGCTHATYRCDGEADCADGSDEDVDMCKAMACPHEFDFDCYVTRAKGTIKDLCIVIAFVCDGAADCVNGEDEFCVGKCHNTTQFQCDDGTCVFLDQTCNNKADCPKGEDEYNCWCDRRTQFECLNHSCIPSVQRCDKNRDCPHGEDEAKCPRPCENFFDFQCSDGTCLSADNKCDGIADCANGGDEVNCPPMCNATTDFQCSDFSCIPRTDKCNIKIDCPGGDDEQNCYLTVNIQSGKSVDGNSITLSCSVQEETRTEPEFTWSYKKEDTDTWITIDSIDEITIDDITQVTAGVYKCDAKVPGTSNMGNATVIAITPDELNQLIANGDKTDNATDGIGKDTTTEKASSLQPHVSTVFALGIIVALNVM